MTGIAQLVLHFLGLLIHGKEGWDAFSQYLGILNLLFLLPFNILAFFKLSKKYAIYTLISSIVQTIVLCFPSFWIGFGIFKHADGTYDIMSCAIVSAVIGGLSNGLMMRRGATSGGIITLCQYLNIKKDKSVGVINLIISSIIVLLGALFSFFVSNTSSTAIGSAISTALYTLTSFALASTVLDFVHTSYNKVKIEIITENGDFLSKALLRELPHGLTTFDAVGEFTGNKKKILNVVVQKYECNHYVSIVKKYDPEAFISIIPIWRLAGRFNIQIIDK